MRHPFPLPRVHQHMHKLLQHSLPIAPLKIEEAGTFENSQVLEVVIHIRRQSSVDIEFPRTVPNREDI